VPFLRLLVMRLIYWYVALLLASKVACILELSDDKTESNASACLQDVE